MMAFCSPELIKYAEFLQERNFPVVLIGRSSPKVCSFISDNTQAARKLVHHLAKHGRKRIAFLGGHLENPNPSSHARRQGYLQGLEDLGIPYDENLSWVGHFHSVTSHLAVSRAMAQKIEFDAILCGNDASAVGALAALDAAGRRVPDDVALASFDDTPQVRWSNPPITTVNLAPDEMGYRAAEKLFQGIHETPLSPEVIEIRSEIITRASCGCYPDPVTRVLTPSVVSLDQVRERLRAEFNAGLAYGNEHLADELSRRLAVADPLNATEFLKEFQQCVQLAMQEEFDPVNAHNLISILRTQSANPEQTGPLFHQARVLCSELAAKFHSSSTSKDRLAELIQYFQSDTSHLLDQQSILQSLQIVLNNIGMRFMAAFLYDFPRNSSQIGQIVIWKSSETCRSHAGTAYDFWKIRLKELSPEANSVEIFDLTADDQTVGFIMLDTEVQHSQLFPELVRQLAMALRLSTAFYDLQTKREDLEKLNAELNREISEREKTEEALREERDLFQRLMDSSSDHIYFKDLQSRFLRVNRAMAEAFGMSDPQKIVGKTDFDFFTSDHANQAFRDEQKVIQTGKPIKNHEEMETWSDGRVTWTSTTKMPLRNSHGEIIGTIGISRDITDRRATIEALKNSEQQFRSIWENSGDGMRLTDDQGIVVDVNPAFCDLVGMSEEEILGRPITCIRPPDEDHSEVLKSYLQRFQEKNLFHFEQQIRLRSGKVLDAEVTCSIIELTQERKLYLSIFRDQGPRRAQEEERLSLERKLLDAQKLESLGVLAGGIAHDFNNLLTGILGNASLASSQIKEDIHLGSFLTNIEKSSVQAAELCQQMLAYSGRGRFEIRTFELNSLIDEMASLLRISIGKKVSLEQKLCATPLHIQADQTQIRQIIMNLVINGAESIHQASGSVQIETSMVRLNAEECSAMVIPPEPGEYILFRVTDTGCGMSPETMKKIFDPFFSTKLTGRGLGLAAVLGIVRGHQGGLNVSSHPGKGTCFSIYFPKTSSTTSSVVQEKGSPPLPSERITGTALVIDDEDSICLVASRMLESFGLEVLTTTDALAGVEMIKSHPEIDFVLLDMTMPMMNGSEVFREIKNIQPQLPIIIMSGYHEAETMEKLSDYKVAGFLQKPFNRQRLLETVYLFFKKPSTRKRQPRSSKYGH